MTVYMAFLGEMEDYFSKCSKEKWLIHMGKIKKHHVLLTVLTTLKLNTSVYQKIFIKQRRQRNILQIKM